AGLSASKSARVFSLGVSGDLQDGLGAGGVNTFSVTDLVGRLDLHDADARAADFSTTHTNGNYNKLLFSGARLQRLDDAWSLYAGVSGQMADKMERGGGNAVRAYPEGEAYGDQGAVANVEARWDLPQWDLVAGHPQLIA